jgi:hypothetical protein
MDEHDGSGLTIRDGTAADVEALLDGRCTCGTHPAGPHEEPYEDLPEPQSEAARMFAAWLDRNPPWP